MNRNHDVCGSEEWRATVRDLIIPWALGDRDLGDDVLEVGPGFGATTDVFRGRVAKLTAVEIDPGLAAALSARLAGTNVVVLEADATDLPFHEDRFTGATCFSMLHHVSSPGLQDLLFSEIARVVRPGGLFVASDSLHSDELVVFHDGDTYVPIDPAGVVERLEGCGFVDATVQTNPFGWAALARVPETRSRSDRS